MASVTLKKILITGSEGYIGSHLCDFLHSFGHDVYRLDIQGQPDYKIDISNQFAIPRATQRLKFDVVIHLAALVRVNESVEKPWLYYDTNVNGTFNALNGFDYDNFIFASTGTASNPINPYALSKRCAEDIVTEYCNEYEKQFTMFRFYNVTGTDGAPATNTDGLFYNLVKAKNEGSFNLFGTDYNTSDGTAVRDYIHVMEVCESIQKAINVPSFRIENLGTGIGYTVKEMIEQFKKSNNCDFDLILRPRREGDLERLVLDSPSNYYTKMYSFDRLMKL
jgi:UDP-glucose 4-epimerase